MRVAELCTTCATYINATCIIYNGNYLTNLDVSPLDSLDGILGKINDSLEPLTGSGEPAVAPTYVGQYYIDTIGGYLWVGMGTGSVNWGLLGTISTTTTTSTSTTAAPTTTTTTTTP